MNWTTQSKVIITNIVSIFALALGLFGVDVSPDAQAQIVAGIGAIAAVVTSILVAFRSRKQLEADEVQAAVKRRQAGFVRPDVLTGMGLTGALVLVVMALPGCNLLPETPRQALAASYVAVETIADSTAIAYRDGHITDSQRQNVRGRLQAALDQLAIAEDLIVQGLDADDPIRRARQILSIAQQYLIEAQTDE